MAVVSAYCNRIPKTVTGHGAIDAFTPREAFSRFPTVQGPRTEGRLRVELARSPGRNVVTSLHRLRDAGLVENRDRRWRLTEPEAPTAPPQKWVAPVRGADRAQQQHLT
jgi:hypothetical protein